jgi:hypothetical protein
MDSLRLPRPAKQPCLVAMIERLEGLGFLFAGTTRRWKVTPPESVLSLVWEIIPDEVRQLNTVHGEFIPSVVSTYRSCGGSPLVGL